MIDRICISINNRCDLSCKYCHFHEKGMIAPSEMDVLSILDHVKAYTRSDPGVSGPELAKAHIQLGQLLAQNIAFPPEVQRGLNGPDTTLRLFNLL